MPAFSMTVKHIPYQQLRFFSDLISDYLDQKEQLAHLYHRYPKMENFGPQLEEKQKEWQAKQVYRQTLVSVLKEQYSSLQYKKDAMVQIDLMSKDTTFTITTGHQLNLFTGPLYFLYKIISTIKLCERLKEEYPAFDFVPVYWMATEDHDFEEIQYFNYGGRKIVYDREAAGAVGRLTTEGLDHVLEGFSTFLGKHDNALRLQELFKEAYLDHDNLAAATQYLAHELFGKDGLIVLDADDARLKKLMIPTFQEELLKHSCHQSVGQTLKKWPDQYNIQVNPREINLFYLTDEYRKRIIKRDGRFYLDEMETSFSQEEIIDLLKQYPERFSPNVLMRPLYQESILPNLCYIGGGGEMAYWLQLKQYFDSQGVVFPILLLRNSALLMSKKEWGKLKRLPVELEDLFLPEHQLAEKATRVLSQIDIDFTPQKKRLHHQFKELYELAEQTDPSFLGAVGAQERKQIKGLEHLEKRLLKAQKRKLSDQVERSLLIQQQLFPNQSLQERQSNFSYFYQAYGPVMIQWIQAGLDPLDLRFSVLVFEE